jgi:hypothetical protein
MFERYDGLLTVRITLCRRFYGLGDFVSADSLL